MGKSLVQVVLHDRYRLESNVEADKVFGDAPALPLIGGDDRVRHGRWIARERFDAAEAFGEHEGFKRGKKAMGSTFSASSKETMAPPVFAWRSCVS